MVLDHIMLKVKSWPTAKVYYEQALAPLGYVLMKDGGTWGGFHNPGDPGSTGRIYVRQEENPGRLHFALLAPSAEAVQEYHTAAIAAGGTDNGAPGPRGHIGVTGCFVTDLDDNNIEVCYHG